MTLGLILMSHTEQFCCLLSSLLLACSKIQTAFLLHPLKKQQRISTIKHAAFENSISAQNKCNRSYIYKQAGDIIAKV